MEPAEDKVGHKPMSWSERICSGVVLFVVAVIMVLEIK